MSRRGAAARSRAVALAVVAVLAVAGCARKMPPPGGRPDVEPPVVSSTVPDSGAVAVSRTAPVEVVFSEPMRRDAPGWLMIGPYVPVRELHWERNVLRFVPAESLRAGQAYTLVVGAGATDERGNALAGPLAVPFTTGAAFPPGSISGLVDARGHRAAGVYVWGYREDLGHAPDSTARDFDALTVAGNDGRFELVGLPVPSRWRLYAFHDANRTLTFEPGLDHLTAADSALALAPGSERADSVVLVSVDPLAPATVTGTVSDSLAPADVAIRVLAEATGITAAARGGRPAPVSAGVEGGGYRLSLEAGRYRVRCYLDLDRNGRLDPAREPASAGVDLEVRAGEQRSGVDLVAPAGPPPGTEP